MSGRSGTGSNEPTASSVSPLSPTSRHTAARDHLVLAVNGTVHQIRGDDAFSSLSTWLRERRRLIGTKIVCSEGDCGACTVLVGSPSAEGLATSGPKPAREAPGFPPGFRPGFQYRALDSCIAFLYQLDGCHVVTVDALALSASSAASTASSASLAGLHPVQRAMAEKFGSQCGFCTPGFVMALAALGEEAHVRGAAPSEAELRTGLSGNLCRCTGYVQILDAAREVLSKDPLEAPAISELFDEPRLAAELDGARRESVRLEAGGRSIAIPASWREALELREREPEAIVVAGATDLGVRVNKGTVTPIRILHLRSDLDEAATLANDGGVWRLGALARWSEVLESARTAAPELARVLELFGAPQIRNAGTVGGNLANASPIADSLPYFYAAGAEVALDSVRGRRSLPIAELFLGYKLLDLRPDELIAEIAVPLPAANESIRLVKVSRRRDLDISTFTAALWLRRESSSPDARIADARLALGGVAPTVVRAAGAEALLCGAPFTLATFRAAGESAAAEIRPISDVRGQADFRRLLARNSLVRFFHELAGETEPAALAGSAR